MRSVLLFYANVETEASKGYKLHSLQMGINVHYKYN